MKPGLGVVLGLPAAGLLVLIGTVMLIGGIVVAVREKWYPDWTRAGFGFLIVAATLVITGIGMWPWQAQYHEWQPESGTITAMSRAFVGSGEQRFVVQFAKGTPEFPCDDTRCALLKVGDQLTLSCERTYQWAGTPGWDCEYVSSSEDTP